MRFRLFSNDLGIDLGTSNVLIFESGKGVVVRVIHGNAVSCEANRPVDAVDAAGDNGQENANNKISFFKSHFS